ncbi:MAG TPA: methyltransferase domain-containing protein [Acidimicrobiales bacterium]|nr:methyltransferase domain-containing protein [Acidimicrobiales bacterium]
MSSNQIPQSNGVWACTIIARNYLPAARVLATSFLSHHPGGRMFVLVLDDNLGELDGNEPFEVLHLDDLAIEPAELHTMAACYSVMELATAVKPWLLETLLRRGTPSVLYLDPDIQVFHSLKELSDLAEEHNIVLTPHVTAPMPRDQKMTSETAILQSGIYNLGFIGVSHGAGPFLQFWMNRLLRECVVDPGNMRFVDQRWVDFVPGMFDCKIFRDPTCNVAYWNLDHRNLNFNGKFYEIDGSPLKFFHFSGYSPAARHLLSKHQTTQNPRILLSERPVVRRICDEYGDLLISNGFGVDDAHPYGFDRMANGVPFDSIMREFYRGMLATAERGAGVLPPDPFDPDGADAMLQLLNEPPGVPGDPGQLTLYQATLFGRRPDLYQHFPDPQGHDRDRFFDWLRASAAEGWIHQALTLPPAVGIGSPPSVEAGNDGNPPTLSTWAPPTQLQPGVMLVGYLRAELGVGQGARLLAEAMDATGIPYATLVNTTTTSRQNHAFEGSANDGRRDFDVNIVCVNADQLPVFAGQVGPGFFAGRYTIGQWAWELEIFPDEFHGALDLVDEVWAVSEFTRAAIAATTSKPVFAVPHPIVPPSVPPGIDRTALGLQEDCTLFLFCFDLLSLLERKNPLGLIEAYSRAFEADGGATLVLKVINGDQRLPDLERLRLAVADRSDIMLIDQYLDADELAALMNVADCYVSLHRSEGFGLTMGEAMALGKPVIATAYSGNLDFMSEDTAYLVGWSEGTVPAGCSPYPQGAKWAEPDLHAAARLMRHVHENPDEAKEVGRRAQQAIAANHSTDQRAQFVRQRFDAIQRQRAEALANAPSTKTAAVIAPTPGAVTPEGLVELAKSRPPLDMTSARFPRFTRFYRRLVLRAQRHHDDHQRQVNVALAEAIKSLEANDRRLLSNVEGTLSTSRSVRLDLSRILGEHGRALEAIRPQIYSANTRTSELGDQSELLTDSLTDLIAQLRAIPYMSDPSVLETLDDAGRPAIGFRHEFGRHGPAHSYAGFEDVFRGPEDFIRERQRIYLPYLVDHDPVIDVGCGRGEMLDLLAATGVKSFGVDMDQSMVDRGSARGLDIVLADGVSYLHEQQEGSIGAVFSAQVIEHLEYEQLVRFHEEAYRALQTGGVFIAETVNPHSISAFKSFWTDLTHRVPIFPEVAVMLALVAGFSEAIVLFPNGTGTLEVDRWSQGEYAVIARK